MQGVIPRRLDPRHTGMIRLICVDVDGTLLGTSREVHPAIWQTATRVRDAGIRLAICSGRPAFGVTRDYAQRLDADGWHAFQNGSSVTRFVDRRTHSANLTNDTVAWLIDRARTTGRDLELYGDFDYVVESTSERARAHAALLGVPFAPRSFDAPLPPIVRAQWLLSNEEAPAVIAQPHPGIELSPSTSPVMPETTFVSLMPLGVNKGTGVQTIADEYGVSLRNVMFVGDGLNDVPALRLVGFPVAMYNAEPEARAAAHRVVNHVDEGGLIEAMEWALHLQGRS